MTSDMSQVTEISTCSSSSDAMLEELPQEEEMETNLEGRRVSMTNNWLQESQQRHSTGPIPAAQNWRHYRKTR